MKNHMDVYLHLNLYYPKYNYPRNQFEMFLHSAIPFQNGIPTLTQMEEMFQKKPPTITQLVQAYDQLLDMAPNKIAQILGITKQSVSYHRHRACREYYNPEFEKYLTPRVEHDFNRSILIPKKRKKRKDSKVMIRQRLQELDELVNRNQN